MIQPNLGMRKWTARLLGTVMMPLVMLLSGCPPTSGGSPGAASYTATLYVDGVKVAEEDRSGSTMMSFVWACPAPAR